MTRFKGLVGFAQEVRTSPGVTEMLIVEHGPYSGDIKRESRTLVSGENLNDDLSTSNTIEIIADAYASENFVDIRYVKWAGAYWKVAEATVQRPRLLLRLGGVYSGPKPASSGTPGPPPGGVGV